MPLPPISHLLLIPLFVSVLMCFFLLLIANAFWFCCDSKKKDLYLFFVCIHLLIFMKELFLEFLKWAKSQPTFGRILIVVAALAVLVQLLFFSSCSVTQTTTVGDHNSTSAGSTVNVQVDSTYMTPTFKF